MEKIDELIELKRKSFELAEKYKASLMEESSDYVVCPDGDNYALIDYKTKELMLYGSKKRIVDWMNKPLNNLRYPTMKNKTYWRNK